MRQIAVVTFEAKNVRDSSLPSLEKGNSVIPKCAE